MSLYEELSPQQVAEAAEKLATWVAEQSYQDDDEVNLGAMGHEVTFRELRDLATLFTCAAEQELKLVAWY